MKLVMMLYAGPNPQRIAAVLDEHEVHAFTEIDRAHRGRGLGAILVAGALDDVRARGQRIVATCWYVADFVEAHPAYRDLLAG